MFTLDVQGTRGRATQQRDCPNSQRHQRSLHSKVVGTAPTVTGATGALAQKEGTEDSSRERRRRRETLRLVRLSVILDT